MDTTLAASPATQDAISLLRSDHKRIEALFAEYERFAQGGASAADKSGLVVRISALVRAHVQVVEEILHPVLRLTHRESDAEKEDHQVLHDLVENLSARKSDGAAFDEQVSALRTAMKAHADFEEHELFPRIEGVDTFELGTRIAMRRGELLGDQGPD